MAKKGNAKCGGSHGGKRSSKTTASKGGKGRMMQVGQSIEKCGGAGGSRRRMRKTK